MADANGVGVDLGIYLDGKQIFSDSSSSPLINILVEGAGSVSYAQVMLPFNFGLANPEVVNAGSVALKDRNTLENDVKNGRAVIKYLKKTTGGSDEELGSDISFLTLSSFEVGYLATTNNSGSYLYPIYVFRAAGPLASGETVEGVVYLPAVK